MNVSVTSAFCFLLLILPQISLQQVCDPPSRVDIKENNEVGVHLLTIPVEEGVKVELDTNPGNSFTLDGNVLEAAVRFDHEDTQTVTVGIACISPDGIRVTRSIVFVVLDVNESPPVFEKSTYEATVNELSPPNTPVGTYFAEDPDANGKSKLYYKLTPESEGFSLVPAGTNGVEVVTTKRFDYDKNKSFQLELYVQDTVIGSSDSPSFNDTATINVTIVDIDNRPPWFLPCTPLEISGTTVCVGEQSYTGSIYLNEQETGALELDPNPIRAVDGDSGLNERIVYSIIGGDGAGVFKIDTSTGSITMLKAVTTPGPITLRVLASQAVNVHQFATTLVSIDVLTRSVHKPKFPLDLYEGIITAVGTMAGNKNDMGTLLRILATDEDYGPEGKNPNIIYSIIGNDNFHLNDGYLFMTTHLPDDIYNLEVLAVDSVNKETAKTAVQVEVKSGPTVPPSTSTTGSLPPDVTLTSAGPTPSTGTTLSGATPSSAGPTPSTGTTISGATPSSAGPTPSTGTTISGATPSSADPNLSTGTTVSGATPSSSGPTPSTGTTVSGATPPPDGPTPSTGTTISGATPSSSGPTQSTGSTISGATPPVSQTSPDTSTGNGNPTAKPTITTDGSGSTASTSIPSVSTPGKTTTTGITSGNVTPSGNPTVETPGTSRATSQNPGGSGATPAPSPTGDGVDSTTNRQPHTEGAPGGFDSTDMAALGATLGVLLLLAIVIMALLFCRLQRESKDWKKIYESNVFRSSMGQNSAKEGVQYTNNAFDNDEDNNKGSSSGAMFSSFPDAKDYSKYESIVEPKLPSQGDDSSQSGSEKEVKPILTKERRVEEGYKSVWFKEDIDPDAKEEVVIIPDSRGNATDDEDSDGDSSSDKETGYESPRRTRRVMFSNFSEKDGGEIISVDL